MIIIARGLSGISQVLYTTYLLALCDQYRREYYRSIMITFVQFSSAIGIIIGYGLVIVSQKNLGDDKSKEILIDGKVIKYYTGRP